MRLALITTFAFSAALAGDAHDSVDPRDSEGWRGPTKDASGQTSSDQRSSGADGLCEIGAEPDIQLVAFPDDLSDTPVCFTCSLKSYLSVSPAFSSTVDVTPLSEDAPPPESIHIQYRATNGSFIRDHVLPPDISAPFLVSASAPAGIGITYKCSAVVRYPDDSEIVVPCLTSFED